MRYIVAILLSTLLAGCGGATLYQFIKRPDGSLAKEPIMQVDGNASFELEKTQYGKVKVDSKSEGLLKSTVKEVTAVTVSREMRGGS